MNYYQAGKAHFRSPERKKNKRKRRYSSIKALVGIACLVISHPANASKSTLTVDDLKTFVAQVFEQEVAKTAQARGWENHHLEYNIWAPSAANYLPTCHTPLVVSSRDNRLIPVGNLKRAVSCESLDSPWRINVTIRATLTLPVLVATTTLDRNETIAASHIKLETRTITRQDDFYTRAHQAIGLETSRRLKAGQIVDPSILNARPMIVKGNEVIIIASKNGFRASTKGIALEDGKKGDQIEIENQSSGKIVRAVVTGVNQVHTQF